MARHLKSLPRRLTTGIGGLLVLAVVIAGGFAAAPPTEASWNDSEWASASLGTVKCATTPTAAPTPSGAFSTNASGKLVGGRVAGVDLDALASLAGVKVQNTGTVATPTPSGARRVDDYTYANPLVVSVADSVRADLGSLLVLPLGPQAGIVNNFGQAFNDGRSLGASGVVNDSGGIQTAPTPTPSTAPTLASVQLGEMLNTLLGKGAGGGVSGLTDVGLTVGAVSSQAALDACAALWSPGDPANLTRKYLIAALNLTLTSPSVSTMTTAQLGLLATAKAEVEALGANAVVGTSVADGTGALLTSGVLGTLMISDVRVTSSTIAMDLAPVRALLAEPITDGTGGIISIDPVAGVTTIDLGALFGSVYGTTGLNGLDPNTPLLVDALVVNALKAAAAKAADALVANLAARLATAVQAARVSATVEVSVAATVLGVPVPVPLASIILTVPDSSLAALQARSGPPATAKVSFVGLPSSGDAILVAGLLTPLTAGIGEVLGDALDAAALGANGVVSAKTAPLLAFTAPLVTAIGSSTSALFGESGLLQLTVNAQNNPALPAPAAAGPTDWATAPGQFDVAALRLTAGSTPPNKPIVSLDFARSSVGPNVLVR